MILTKKAELVVPSNKSFDLSVKKVHLVFGHDNFRMVVSCHQFVKGLPEFDIRFAE